MSPDSIPLKVSPSFRATSVRTAPSLSPWLIQGTSSAAFRRSSAMAARSCAVQYSAVTVLATPPNSIRAIDRRVDAGPDYFLSQPVQNLELITRVKSLLHVRHLKRELDRTMAYIQDVNPQDNNETSNDSS